ncbi:conserved hypothetical protein (plasmid) [Borreliella finlandensis]|uniref:Uncharacterized protein n=1 Tax=Borreliella finlandensis TaxID=498741 RepID=A0A806C702_9SPIR|nr:hypothetical protein [Borreliella finlandensis]ACN93620.1 conserved hypothetical protein [Borreliella finlandensis]
MLRIFNYSNQKSQEETTVSKLESIAKILEAQKEKENTEIEKINKLKEILEKLQLASI